MLNFNAPPLCLQPRSVVVLLFCHDAAEPYRNYLASKTLVVSLASFVLCSWLPKTTKTPEVTGFSHVKYQYNRAVQCVTVCMLRNYTPSVVMKSSFHLLAISRCRDFPQRVLFTEAGRTSCVRTTSSRNTKKKLELKT